MRRVVVTLICFTLASAAYAEFVTGFEASEGYSGSASGVLLTGQQGWYNPVAGSADGKVYTYTGNPYSIPQNPFGGAQFFGGRMEGSAAFARSQRNYDWASETEVRITYDWCAKYTGTLPAVDNLASWSMQPSSPSIPGTQIYMQSLYTWADLAGGTLVNAGYLTNESSVAPGVFPSAAWQNLPVNHWFRQSVVVNMTSKLISECSIRDLTTGGPTTTVNPIGWHFINYSAVGGTLPTAFRFFTGGGAGSSPAGNFMGWDNVSIPEPASLVLLMIGLAALRRR
jgi:hypothetical protein